MARVRVRGIAATALTKLLMDKGHVIVQASQVIQRRFGIPLNTAPADVTVKDGDTDELVVIGFPREAESVLGDIVSTLEDVFVWRPRLNLYSVVTGRVVDVRDNTCLIELPHGVIGELRDCSWETGRLVTVSIVKPAVKPWEKPRLSTSIRVVGEYVSLIYGSQRLSISEHVRSSVKRRELLAAATAAVMGKGYGVHLRSSSAYASPEDIVREISVLEEMLKGIMEKARGSSQPEIIYEGELVALISLSSNAKKILDEIRDRVTPTIPMHHSLKCYGGSLSDIVDYAETALARGCSRDLMAKALNDYILDKLVSSRIINIVHITPGGERVRLTPGKIESVVEKGDGYIIRLKRVFRGHGVLDGLGVEKNPGDYSETIVETGKWYIIHNYHRSNGEYIGTYININTPPEILPDTIKYHDLVVDIIYRPGEKPEIIDQEELEKHVEQGIIPEKLRRKIDKALEEAMKKLGDNHKNQTKTNTRNTAEAGVPEPGQRGRAEDPMA